MFNTGYMIASICWILLLPQIVSARFCEGGHICSLPRECCTQGCCPPYQSGPRQLPPATDHVLNLFFINHWYFWCLMVAILLAIFCAYSLWKKRRTLCGWGFSEHHSNSEGDSAGSCYVPPQYSRCNSFHHPPPPYTEVTSKPDLYPLVFTCNSDNGKNGASYLMVQYFRNYIVRPAGSLSATSTVDSLSSSFICNANESNILVPPPYSRAASPEMGFQQHFMMPRSASQMVCSQENAQSYSRNHHHHSGITESMPESVGVYQHGPVTGSRAGHQMRGSESVQFQMESGRPNTFITSQSDQQFHYIANSNSSLSDIFASSGIGTDERIRNSIAEGGQVAVQTAQNNNFNNDILSNDTDNNKPSTNTNTSTNLNQVRDNRNPVYNSCGSIGGISITVPAATEASSEHRDLDVLRRSLETCCQILQKQQSCPVTSDEQSSTSVAIGATSGLRNYNTSATCSAVSSLANIGSPASPPQAISPTDEVREILDQIRQLHIDNSLAGDFSQIAEESAQMPSVDCMSTSCPGPVPQPSKRPSSLHQQTKKKFFSKPNKAMYFPMVPNSNPRSIIKSPVSASTFLNRSRTRKCWISRSAPTTPGTGLPPNRLGDDSPLLIEHDEDQDCEQNV